jgi:hypothetical protein
MAEASGSEQMLTAFLASQILFLKSIIHLFLLMDVSGIGIKVVNTHTLLKAERSSGEPNSEIMLNEIRLLMRS